MIRLPLLIACALAGHGLALGQALTQSERDRAMSELHATRKAFLDTVSELSDAQWRFTPGPGRWSAAQCAEHIAASEDLFFEMVTKKILASPAAPPDRRPGNARDEQALKHAIDRSARYQAPQSLQPSGRYAGRDALVNHFKNSRDRIIAYVRTTQDPLRAHVASHPVLGELDAYQWILLVAGHTQRHLDQVRELRADPRFPRR